MKNLQDLFEDTLKDIYYAEKKITKELPKMAKKASDPELKTAFEDHLRETEQQVERLEQVFELIGKAPRGKKCPAIDGIAEEAAEIMKEAEDEAVCDAGLLAAAQAVEHYEMARYGTLCAWARELDLGKVIKLLEATLDEEKNADSKLSKIAESSVNQEAVRQAA